MYPHSAEHFDSIHGLAPFRTHMAELSGCKEKKGTIFSLGIFQKEG